MVSATLWIMIPLSARYLMPVHTRELYAWVEFGCRKQSDFVCLKGCFCLDSLLYTIWLVQHI
jgi:hypothetical protein